MMRWVPMGLMLPAIAVLLAGTLSTAWAQSGPDGAQGQDLYQDALQSIAEGRRDDASAELRRLIDRQPMHAGAWIDLAMTQCALGHGDEAERLFAIIETRFKPSDAMLQLIAETREAGCSRWHPQTSFMLTTGRGIDQNVNQGASRSSYVLESPTGSIEYALSSDFLPHHDQYTMVAADVTRELSANGTNGFAQFLERRNDHLHRYDSTALFAGVDTPWHRGRWTLHTAASVGAITLGGHDYQHQAQLQARVAPPLSLPDGMQSTLLTSVTHTTFQTLENFNSTTYELRGLLTYRREGWYGSASLGRMDDRAGSRRPGGGRSGWYGNVLARRALGGRWNAELAYSAQTWHGELPYSAGLIDTVRYQATQSVRATLSYQLRTNQTLQLEARAVHNHENISIFQYNNRQVQLSWQWRH